MMKYAELDLDKRLTEAIEKLGYNEATPIQEQSIPHILEGKDIAGLAQTGTGKTAAYLIPLIERILKAESEPAHPRAFKDWQAYQCILILVPTRELAEQIHENIEKLTVGCGLKSFPFYGGTGYDKQKEALKNGLHFMVSTPGRLIDLYKEHHVDFKKVRAVVFDEADRMFDMGFKDDMKYILSRIERNRQFLVFSATLNFDVLNTAYQFGAEPVEINISRDQAKADHVKDAVFHLGQDEKPVHLLSLLKKENPKQAIVFTNFKNSVDRIAQFLTANGWPAVGLSSLMSQSQRNQVMGQIKENSKSILVATDVAARGLDISDVDVVINYELPQDAESYVHRIGRTGRAGNEGKAFSFSSEKDVDSLTRIEEFTKKKITIEFLEDTDMVKDFVAMGVDDFYKNRGSNQRGDRKDRGDRRSQGGKKPFRDKDTGGYSKDAHFKDKRSFDKSYDKSNDKVGDRSADNRSRAQSVHAYGANKDHKHGSSDSARGKQGSSAEYSKNVHNGSHHGKKNFNKDRKSKGADESRRHHNKVNDRASAPEAKRVYRTSSKSGLGGKIASFFKSIFK